MTETSISLFPRRVRRKLVPLGGVHLKIGSVGTKARAIEALHFGKTTTIEELSLWWQQQKFNHLSSIKSGALRFFETQYIQNIDNPSSQPTILNSIQTNHKRGRTVQSKDKTRREREEVTGQWWTEGSSSPGQESKRFQLWGMTESWESVEKSIRLHSPVKRGWYIRSFSHSGTWR